MRSSTAYSLLALAAAANAGPILKRALNFDGIDDKNNHNGGDAFIKSMLDTHNAARIASGVPPVTWSTGLAEGARSYGKACPIEPLEHSKSEQRPGQGENLAFSSGSSVGDMVTNFWAGEIKDYDFNNPGFSHGTGHYTQVVWKDTTEIGCDWEQCTTNNGVDVIYLICRYSPQGNINNSGSGDKDKFFRANVFPPNSGDHGLGASQAGGNGTDTGNTGNTNQGGDNQGDNQDGEKQGDNQAGDNQGGNQTGDNQGDSNQGENTQGGESQGNTDQGNTDQGNTNQGNTNQGDSADGNQNGQNGNGNSNNRKHRHHHHNSSGSTGSRPSDRDSDKGDKTDVSPSAKDTGAPKIPEGGSANIAVVPIAGPDATTNGGDVATPTTPATETPTDASENTAGNSGNTSDNNGTKTKKPCPLEEKKAAAAAAGQQ